MWHLIPPRVEHLQALLLAGSALHHWWHEAFLAPLLVTHWGETTVRESGLDYRIVDLSETKLYAAWA
jgi:hypothetical protein